MDLMRKPRRRMITIAIVSSVMISLVGLAAYAWVEKREAATRGRIALLAAQSRSLLESESDLALLLSLEANRLAENLAGSATLGTGLLKKAAFALSNENSAAGAAKSSLFAALTLLPQRVRFFHEAGQIMAFSPDGQKFAFLEDQNLVIHDLASGQQVSQPLTGINHIENIDGMTFSSDGHLLALRRWGGSISWWEVGKGQSPGPTLNGRKDGLHGVISPDGKLLASITEKGVVIRDLISLKPLYELEHSGNLQRLIFSQNGQSLLCGDDNGRFIRWDLATRQPLILPFTIDPDAPPYRRPLTSVDLSPDGNVAALLDLDSKAGEQTITLYDVPRGRQVGRIWTDRSDLMSLAFSPNGKILAARGEPGVFRWEVLRQRPLPPLLTGHLGWVANFRFSPDGKHLASADNLGNIILWNLTGTSLSHDLGTKNLGVECVAFTPQGRAMALAGTALEIWEMAGVPQLKKTLEFSKDDKTGKLSLREDLEPRESRENLVVIYRLAYSPDGQTLELVDGDGDIHLWDLTRGVQIGQPVKTSFEFYNRVALTFTPEGQALAAVSSETGITLWKLSREQTKGEPLTGGKEHLSCLAFSPDARLLAAGDNQGNIFMWEVAKGNQPLPPLAGQAQTLNSSAFSPDGRLLASWYSSANIKLWDVAGRRQVGRSFTKIGADNIVDLSFSPDGRTLAVLYDLQEACLWDVGTGAMIGSLPDSPYKSGYFPRRLRHSFLAYSPDGKTLVWASTGDKVMLYDVNLQSWKNRARGIANRHLTSEERQQYLGEQP
ncbi:MAG: hypothetical protein NTY36_00175 [Deltaproteobacteria bacterium]|nr:hypothetical protein [Deltaproteobacteria bacterium]